MDKLYHFSRDTQLVELVKQELLKVVLSDDSKDVYVLAAQRLAQKYIEQGFRSISRLQPPEDEPPVKTHNPGI